MTGTASDWQVDLCLRDNDSRGTLTEGYYGSVLPLAVVMAIPNAAWCSVLFEIGKVFEDVSLRHDACIDSYLPATNSERSFCSTDFLLKPSTLWHRGSHLCALHTQWGGGVYSGVLHLLCRGINDFLQPNIGSTTNFPSPVTVCRLLPQDADTTNTAWGILGVFSSVTALQSSPAMPVLDSLTWAQHTNRLQMAEWQNVLLNIFWIGKIKQARTTGQTCPTQAVACSSSWCLLAFSYIFSDFVF